MTNVMGKTWKSIYVDTVKILEDIGAVVEERFAYFDAKFVEDIKSSETHMDCYRISSLVEKYRLNATASDVLKFPPIYYTCFSTVFQIFEHFKFGQNEDGTLTFGSASFKSFSTSFSNLEMTLTILEGVVGDSDQVQSIVNYAFETVLDTSMVLSSSNVFPEQKSFRAKLGRGLTEIFEQSKRLGLATRSDNELTILTHTAAYLDDNNVKDVARKAEILQKVSSSSSSISFVALFLGRAHLIITI